MTQWLKATFLDKNIIIGLEFSKYIERQLY